MDLTTLEALHGPAGQEALALAMELRPTEERFLRCFNALAKRFPAALARGAVETALLRQRGLAKFARAEAMFFTREALEQASSETVARYRAGRFAGFSPIADLCCGIGGDAIALTEQAEVVAIDRDPVRLALCGYNLEAHGRRPRARLLLGDVLTIALSGLAAAFADPDRRVSGQRQRSVHACQPPLEALRARVPSGLPFAVKLAPGVPWNEVERYDAEVEFLSLEGELKECVLWFGPLAGPRRRATLLPGGQTLSARTPAPVLPGGRPLTYLYDPDPAVIRAGLVSDLAQQLDARPLDPSIAYLTGDHLVATPFARAFVVDEAMPFHLQRLRACLRRLEVGQIQVSRRGSPIDPEELVRKLKPTGGNSRTVVLTQVEGRPWALVVRRVSGADSA